MPMIYVCNEKGLNYIRKFRLDTMENSVVRKQCE